jgi:Fe-S-cluster containining protein
MLACPVLDLETGSCRLYEHRPAACRTYGPAVRLDGVDLTPCPLNYDGWTPEQVEAARVGIETADLSPAALTAMGATGELTTVAHVLAAR